MRFAAKANPARFVQFAERIFGLSGTGPDDLDCALAGIDRFAVFLKSIGCPTHFSELGIDDRLIETYAQSACQRKIQMSASAQVRNVRYPSPLA